MAITVEELQILLTADASQASTVLSCIEYRVTRFSKAVANALEQAKRAAESTSGVGRGYEDSFKNVSETIDEATSKVEGLKKATEDAAAAARDHAAAIEEANAAEAKSEEQQKQHRYDPDLRKPRSAGEWDTSAYKFVEEEANAAAKASKTVGESGEEATARILEFSNATEKLNAVLAGLESKFLSLNALYQALIEEAGAEANGKAEVLLGKLGKTAIEIDNVKQKLASIKASNESKTQLDSPINIGKYTLAEQKVKALEISLQELKAKNAEKAANGEDVGSGLRQEVSLSEQLIKAREKLKALDDMIAKKDTKSSVPDADETKQSTLAWKMFSDTVKTAFSSLKDFSGYFDRMQTALGKATPAVAVFGGALAGLSIIIAGVKAVINVMVLALRKAVSILQSVAKAAANAIKFAFEGAITVLTKTVSVVASLSASIAKAVSGAFVGILATVGTVLSKIGSSIITIFGGAISAITSVASAIGSFVKTAGSAVTKALFAPLKLAINAVGTLGDKIKSLWGRITNMLTRQIIRKSVNALVQSVSDGVDLCASKSTMLEKNISQLKGAFSAGGASVASAFTPVIAAATPVLLELAQAAIAAANAIGKFFATLFGTSYTVVSLTGSVEDLSGAAGGAGKAAKEALASFDKLNVLTQNSGGGGGGGGAGSGFTIAEADVESGASKLAQMLKNGLFRDAGEYVAGWASNLLAKLKEQVQNTPFESIGADIAELINGFNADETMFVNLGDTIALAIKGVLTGANALFSNLDAAKIGENIATTINGLTINGVPYQLGVTIKNYIGDACDLATGFISVIDLNGFAQQIADGINVLFADEKLAKKLGATIHSWVVSGIAAADTLIRGINAVGIADSIATLIGELKLGETFTTLGSTIWEFIKKACEFATTLVDEKEIRALPYQVAQGINSFFSNRENFQTLGKSLSRLLISTIGDVATTLKETDFKTIGDRIYALLDGMNIEGTMSALGDLLLSLVTSAIDLASGMLNGGNFSGLCRRIIQGITTWFGEHRTEFDGLGIKIGTIINSVVEGLAVLVKPEKFASLGEAVSKHINEIAITVDAEKLGGLVNAGIMSALAYAKEHLDPNNINFTLLGKKLAEFIGGLDLPGIAYELGDVIWQGINAAVDFAKGFLSEGQFANLCKEIIAKATSWFNTHKSEFNTLGTKIGEIINEVVAGLDELVKPENFNDLAAAISGFLTNLAITVDTQSIGQLIHDALMTAVNLARALIGGGTDEGQRDLLGTKLSEFLKGLKLGELASNVGGLIHDGIIEGISLIEGLFAGDGEKRDGLGTAILNFINGISFSEKECETIGRKLHNIIIGAFNWLARQLDVDDPSGTEEGGNIVTKIIAFLDGLSFTGDELTTMKETLRTALSTLMGKAAEAFGLDSEGNVVKAIVDNIVKIVGHAIEVFIGSEQFKEISVKVATALGNLFGGGILGESIRNDVFKALTGLDWGEYQIQINVNKVKLAMDKNPVIDNDIDSAIDAILLELGYTGEGGQWTSQMVKDFKLFVHTEAVKGNDVDEAIWKYLTGGGTQYERVNLDVNATGSADSTAKDIVKASERGDTKVTVTTKGVGNPDKESREAYKFVDGAEATATGRGYNIGVSTNLTRGVNWDGTAATVATAGISKKKGEVDTSVSVEKNGGKWNDVAVDLARKAEKVWVTVVVGANVIDSKAQKIMDALANFKAGKVSTTISVQREGMVEKDIKAINTAMKEFKNYAKTFKANINIKLGGDNASKIDDIVKRVNALTSKTVTLTFKILNQSTISFADIDSMVARFKKYADSTFKLVVALAKGWSGSVESYLGIAKATIKVALDVDPSKNKVIIKPTGPNGTIYTATARALGGLVDQGTFFLAGEAGPEIVGYAGGKTGVMNVGQLSSAVRDGVYGAMSAQNKLLSEQNALLRKIAGKDLVISPSAQLGQVVARSQTLYGRV